MPFKGLFNTHLTFICSSFLGPLEAFEHKKAFFLGHPVFTAEQLTRTFEVLV